MKHPSASTTVHTPALTPESTAHVAVVAAFARALSHPAYVPGARLLLACSAGGDSRSLLALMTEAAPARNWQLAIAHVDHRQRLESADEAAWLENLAVAHDLPFFLERLPDGLAAASPLSEDVMRQARHAAWRRIAADWNADAVVLAHQADDRAETFLIRLLAGSGPTGLGSISPVETIEGLTLVRPLLEIRREDLRAFLRARGLAWHDDPTNESMTHKRGWVRHGLLPSIEAHIGLDPTPRIIRASELIEAEAKALTDAAHLILCQLSPAAEPPVLAALDLRHAFWKDASAVLRRQLVREWLRRLRPVDHPPPFAALEEAMKFIAANRRSAELRTVGGLLVVHCKRRLLAFAPETPPEQRRAIAQQHLESIEP